MCYLLPAAAVAVATLVTVCRQGATERDREKGREEEKGLRILGTCRGNSPLCPLSV